MKYPQIDYETCVLDGATSPDLCGIIAILLWTVASFFFFARLKEANDRNYLTRILRT